MKTPTLRTAFLPAIMLVTLIVMVAVSCRKDSTDYIPVPPGPPEPPATPDVFSNKPLYMMADDEIANNADFPGHIINRVGNGLVGGEGTAILDPLEEVGSLIWEIYDYEHTEAAFNEIDQGLDNLQNQVGMMNSCITQP